MRELRHRIAWVLETKGLSARAWAAKSGVSAPYINMLRKGERGGRGLTPETAGKLAGAAGIDPTWLLTGEGSPEPGVAAPDAPEDLPVALVQALTLLGDRIDGPVRVALRAEKAGKTWSVDQWVDRARDLQRTYDRVVKEFDGPSEN